MRHDRSMPQHVQWGMLLLIALGFDRPLTWGVEAPKPMRAMILFDISGSMRHSTQRTCHALALAPETPHGACFLLTDAGEDWCAGCCLWRNTLQSHTCCPVPGAPEVHPMVNAALA
jgi:hypothetical protein